MSIPIYKLPQAERDIEECFVYIAEENLEAGLSFLLSVEASFDQNFSFPKIGTNIRYLANKKLGSIRMWPVTKHENYLIFYRILRDRIEIIRVLNSSRDTDTLLNIAK